MPYNSCPQQAKVKSDSAMVQSNVQRALQSTNLFMHELVTKHEAKMEMW
jgi:hypothetical protein